MNLILESHLSYPTIWHPHFVLIKISANLYGDKCSAILFLSGLIFRVLFVLSNISNWFSLSPVFFPTSLFFKYAMSTYKIFTYSLCPVIFLSCMNHYPNISGTQIFINLRRINERMIYKSESWFYSFSVPGLTAVEGQGRDQQRNW